MMEGAAPCHRDHLNVPLSPSLSFSLGLTHTAWLKWREGGMGVVVVVVVVGGYEYDPEIFHCGPMSGSEDI